MTHHRPRWSRPIPARPLAVALGLLLAAQSAAASAPALSESEKLAFFETKIRPVLAKHCLNCHSGSVQARGGLRLDTRVGHVIGGQSGPAISLKDPASSKILDALRYEGPDMPPAGKLPESVARDFETWIALGAPDPRIQQVKYKADRPIDFDAERKKWAYQPPKAPSVPKPADGWAWTDVDRFVRAKQNASGTHPVADASAAKWLRRVSYDLVGLPPTPEQLARIESDASRESRAKIVDELLALPQFGERWGRHWLDVARFAESTGKERNFVFPQAYRYRDWVIDALNRDQPYDQFLREQVAGDLLPSPTPEQRDARLIATGFLALGPKGMNERNRESFLLDIADEQIENIGRAVVAQSIGCARCHDHKFDPYTMADYYALAGIFRSSVTRAGVVNRQFNAGQPDQLVALASAKVSGPSPDEPKLLAAIAALDKKRQAKLGPVRRLREAASPEVLATLAAANAANFNGNTLGERPRRTPATVEQILAEPAPAPEAESVPAGPPPAPGSIEELRAKQAELNAVNRKLFRLRDERAKRAVAATAAAVLDSPEPSDIAIRLRGEADKFGPVVPRGFPRVFSADGKPPEIGSTESGRRQLADWLTQPDHPLTSRVIVNRIWAKLFGVGIVPTIDDFGSQGQEPTNPALLDHLAVDFVRNGWSIKRTIRELVLTRAYQLDDADDAADLAKDEANESLWRWNRKRLDAEAIRDGILLASGRLDPSRPAGSPVVELGLRELGPNSDFSPIQAPSRRRSVYLPILRGKSPEALGAFDFPDPSLVTGQRDSTTSAAQALYLLNSPFALEQSEALARRLLDDAKLDDAARIERAFKLVLSRKPTPAESKSLAGFLGGSPATPEARLASWSRLAQALLSLPEARYLF